MQSQPQLLAMLKEVAALFIVTAAPTPAKL